MKIFCFILLVVTTAAGQINNPAAAVPASGTTGQPAVYTSGTAIGSSTSITSDVFFTSGRPWVDVQAKGAKGDGQVVNDGVTNGTTTVTSASALFAAGDVGKTVICLGCNAGTNRLTTVSAFVSSSNVTLAASATLTLPVVINCTGCSTVAYGYATVNSSGAITGGTVTATGTSGATACTATILIQQTQSGSGGTLNCVANTGADGIVDSLSVNAAGSGYLATLYWGTDDSTAISNALVAAGTINGCTFISPAQKSFYLMNTRLAWSQSNTCIFGAGKYTNSYIVGDPGNVALILQSLTSNQEMWGLKLANVHNLAATAADRFDFILECAACSHVDYHDLQFAAGRIAVQVETSGSSIPTYIREFHNYCNKMTDVCLNFNGGTPTTPNQFMEVFGNFSTNMIYTLLDGAGHDFNFEDTGDLLVTNNYATEAADTTQPNESCYQINSNHVTAGIKNITFLGNHCLILSPSATSTLTCWQMGHTVASNTYTDVLIEGNTCDGGTNFIAWTGVTAANQIQNVQIKGNNATNCGWNTNGCIYFSVTTGLAEGVSIEGNMLKGSGATGLGPGMGLNRMFGIRVVNNSVSQFGLQGIALAGIQKSLISNNTIFDNSASSTGGFDGILCQVFTVACANNIISSNVIYDDQGTQNQRYGIRINSAQTGNKIIGNIFPGGNKTDNIDDENVTTGANNCTMYEGTIGCDEEPVTINSLTATTLVPTAFNTTTKPMTFLVTIASECTAVNTSTLQWQVNYTGLNGAITQTGTSHACTAAGQFTDTFTIRSTGATAVTYQAVVANAPAFRDKATVTLR